MALVGSAKLSCPQVGTPGAYHTASLRGSQGDEAPVVPHNNLFPSLLCIWFLPCLISPTYIYNLLGITRHVNWLLDLCLKERASGNPA